MNNSFSVGGALSQPPPIARSPSPMVRSDTRDVAAVAVQGQPELSAQAAVNGVSPQKPPSPGQLSKMVGDMQRKVATYSPELQFSIDQDSGKSIVKLTDKSTNTLIWQFPSDEAMQVAKELDQYQQGLVVNHTA